MHMYVPWLQVIFFGGLEHGPRDRLALLDTNNWQWLPVQPFTGVLARYGHAAGVFRGLLWIVGGCDGQDIRRDGDDFRDVCCLDIHDICQSGSVSLLSTEQVVIPADWPLGRELAYATFGNKVGTSIDLPMTTIVNHKGKQNWEKRKEWTTNLKPLPTASILR